MTKLAFAYKWADPKKADQFFMDLEEMLLTLEEDRTNALRDSGKTSGPVGFTVTKNLG